MSAALKNTKPETQQSPQLISSVVLGTVLFVLTEVMFFSGLLSAYSIIKATNFAWAIPTNITLPVLVTGINTAILIASGLCSLLALVFHRPGDKKGESTPLSVLLLYASCILGAIFVLIQGYEWLELLSFGFTMQSGLFAASFFLLIGTHGLHALAGVLTLSFICLKKSRMNRDNLLALNVFWWFVVGIWPVVYALVYF